MVELEFCWPSLGIASNAPFGPNKMAAVTIDRNFGKIILKIQIT